MFKAVGGVVPGQGYGVSKGSKASKGAVLGGVSFYRELGYDALVCQA